MTRRMVILPLVGVISLLAGCASGPGKGLSVSDLRCEYSLNPMGIDEPQPRLTWILDSAARGQKQTAYQVQVATSRDKLAAGQAELWDSGQVTSDASHLVEYAGRDLTSNARCWWRVRVWDRDGRPSAWSRPAMWSMGLLAASDWTGKWIGRDEEAKANDALVAELKQCRWIWYPEGNPAAAAPAGNCYFRRTVTLPAGATVRRAAFVLSADNQFTLFINGKWIGAGSDFTKAANMDVTRCFHDGPNQLAVHVINAGDKPNPAGLIGLLKIELEQGEPILIRTDEEWRTVNKDTANWEKPETDFSSWAAAKPIAEFGGAPWTKLTVVESDNRPLPARHLRREFDADKPIRQATAHICGLGYYELYLNGNRVGNHVLDPNYTHYSKRAHYVTYDVGDMLRKGRNAVGVILGNSRYYAPRSAYPFATVDYGFPKLLLQMRIEYADGTTADIVSDESWKLTTNGPIRENNDYDGEVFDARMDMPGWAAAGFDDSKWEPAQAVKAPEGVLSAQMAPPIRVTETLKPVSLTNPRPGVYVYDMGQNFVGWVRLKVQGPAGTRVRLRHAEALDKDGTVYMENLRSARCADEYTLKGSGAETYEPRFTYHGFQFVELTGYPGTPTLETIEGKAVHSDVEPMGKFTCSDATINRIVRNIHWGIRGNLRSIPTDCPQRDERHGWLGDIANESKGESFEFNMATFFTKWLRDISDSQNEKGSIPDVAPPYWVMYNDNVTWPATYTLIPGWFYEQYGDKRLVAANYPGICRWIAHMRGYMKDDLMPRDTYGDWCVPPESPELIHSKDPARKTDPELLGSSYFFHCVQLAARYAELLGKADDAKQFRELAAKMKTAFNRKFFHADKGIYSNGTQTSCVLPLAFGLVAEEHRAAVFRNLVDDIVVKNKGHIATGLVGGQWLMRALTAGGRPDVAYGIATKTDYPSWGYMAEKGATTIWELWNGDTADPAMNSRNHLMLVGDLSIWLYESIGGIKSDAAKPGFKHIVMRPIPIVGLASAAASHNSMYGMIRSEWKIEGGRFIWNVTVPVNTTATVYVPSVDGAQVAESGKLASQADGVTFLRNEDGAAIYELASGSYRFIAPHRPIAH